NDLQPCTATASFFAYARNNLVICCRHNSLEIQRVFEGHSAKVDLLVADAHKGYSASEIIFSYDGSKVGICWDLLTGREKVQFVTREVLTAAIWLNNRKIALGFATGMLSLFELSSAKHVSTKTIDSSISALSTALDGNKFAIGYHDGTILIANLAPRFTILNQLSMPNVASPIVSLSWHRSFTILAGQNGRGDLCCWHTKFDPPKLVRRFKPLVKTTPGTNWMGWSKNGRIVQFFSARAPLALRDVRTKRTKCKAVPMPEIIKGLAIYSPGAMLFVLGAKHTIQQIKLEPNLELVATVQN
ncbi:WD40-repeat-containing domain protein, partial [Dactylonectria macrodidyma]